MGAWSGESGDLGFNIEVCKLKKNMKLGAGFDMPAPNLLILT